MRANKILAILALGCLFFNMQCDEDDGPRTYIPYCSDEYVSISSDDYENAQSDSFSLIGAGIDSDCLVVNLSASGCGGESWELELIDSGSVMESFPPQRNLKFKFINIEACLAVLTKRFDFDITSLQIDGVSEVLLNIEGIEEPVLYSY